MKRSRFLIIFISLVFAAGILAAILVGTYFYFREVPPRPFAKVTTLAGGDGVFGEPFGIAVKGGEEFVSDGDFGKIWKIDAAGGVTVLIEGLDTPSGLAFLGNDLIVADAGSNTLKKVDLRGKAEIVAGIDGSPGFAEGTAAESQFHGPTGVAVALDGRIFVADTYNDRIRVIQNGRTSTVSGSSRGFADGLGNQAKFDTPTGLAVWGDRLLVADTGNRRIRVVEKDGTTWTLCGTGRQELVDGLLSAASFVEPTALAVGRDGRVYITDGNAIRQLDGNTVPLVTTISGQRRGLRDGSAARARFDRPSGLALAPNGDLFVADSENRLIRRFSSDSGGREVTPEQIRMLSEDPAKFRDMAPARWPFDPPTVKRDIAGTLGELRGEIRPGDDDIHFHNGLDIAGSYGETARFVRDEKVLRPLAAENFGTLRELVRMPTLGYIHIRLGRYVSGQPFGDPRFLFTTDTIGKMIDVRVPRGSHFHAGEPIGTLNPMNHVHLIAGRSGSEMNALDALVLPGVSDTRPPTIEKAVITDENWHPLETKSADGRILLSGKSRIIVRAYDQVDGNAERRRLGVYEVGYQLLKSDLSPAGPMTWSIKFDRLPDAAAVRLVYAEGSRSGATGETIFNYIATNHVEGNTFGEGFLDVSTLAPSGYVVRVSVGDEFGNHTSSDIKVEVTR